ncbi:MAG: hypothetical protein ACREDO_00060, partial [Methyloceanibacter sp.]
MMFPASRRRAGSRALFWGSAAVLAAMFICLLSSFASSSALAQDGTPVQRTYINPFPNGDRYRIVVLGDSLGEGLWGGLYRAFEGDGTLEFINRSQKSSGLLSS